MSAADFWVGPSSVPDTYRLISLLGGGGEGEVWQAELPLSAEGRGTVAVKILPARPGDEEDWERTGRLLRTLHHPGLVRVTDIFTGPFLHRAGLADPKSRAGYVVMDHIEGVTLREWCDENPDASVGERIRKLRTVASALDEMHSGATTHIPVAHGDVKPANIVVRAGGGTILVDLGLTRLTDATGVSGRSAAYAAPELRLPGAMATPEADRYAFAVTTAQVLIGQPLPTGPDGWLDEAELERLLHVHPLTARRPTLIRHVLTAVLAPPEGRPRQLRPWLDAATETLSQVTAAGAAHSPGVHGDTTTVPATTGIPTTATPGATPGATPPMAGNLTGRSADADTQLSPHGGNPPRTPTGPAADQYVGPGADRRANPPGRGARRAMLAAAVAAVLVLVGGVYYVVASGDGSDDADPGALTAATSPAVLTTTAPTATAAPTATTTTDGATSTTGPGKSTGRGGASPSPGASGVSGLPATSMYLTELDIVDKDNTNANNGYATFEEAKISGGRYGHTVTLSASCYNKDGGDYWVEYDLSREWSTFTATVGLRDDSPATAAASYTLLADNSVIAEGTLVLGDAKPVDVPVLNVLRLRLKINVPPSTGPNCDYDYDSRVVWGDPTLHPAQG